jgi:hypothetical protein
MKLVPFKDVKFDTDFYEPVGKEWYHKAFHNAGTTPDGFDVRFAQHEMVEIPDPE